MEEIREKLIYIIENHGIGLDTIDILSELDSLEFISMMVEIEEEFEITLPDDFLNVAMFNIDSVCNYIWDNRGKAKTC